MVGRSNPVEALVRLPLLQDSTDRAAAWRQAVTGLGVSTRVAGPPPLDGVAAEQLVRACRTAISTKLVDDVDWIAPGAAAVALYEITATLPAGSAERREFGRRVFARLYRGDAATFAAVATRMALTNAKPLEAATMRARVGLVLDTSVGTTVHSDPLAYALAARRSLFVRWVDEPSMGALAARRLSAIIVEHAAREGLRRALDGDPQPLDLFSSAHVAPVFERLLADREPLVWQHAAVARGLLAGLDTRLREEIEIALDPSSHPGRWRRAAVSLVALMVMDPTTAIKQCRKLLQSDLAKRDPGMAATMIWGLPRVVEAEPDAAEELLDWLSASRRPDVAEATAMLIREVANPDFGRRALDALGSALASGGSDELDGLRAIFNAARERRDIPDADRGVYGSVCRALLAYETSGARQAYEAALQCVHTAQRVMDVVEALATHGRLDDADLVALVVDLDASILERSRLSSLLLLGRRPGDGDATVPELEDLLARLGRWLIDCEDSTRSAHQSSPAAIVARQRRLRALLHLMDVESTAGGDGSAGLVEERARRTVLRMLDRIAEGADMRLHRILCATLARAADSTVREAHADPSDLFLLTARRLNDVDSIEAIAEGSTSPDVGSAFSSYARFLRMVSHGAIESIAAGSFDLAVFSREVPRGNEAAIAKAFVTMSQGLAAGGSYRSEALRQVVLRMGRALETIVSSSGLSELVDTRGGGPDPLGELEAAANAYERLEASALRRFSNHDEAAFEVVTSVAPLSALIARTVSTGVGATPKQISMAMAELTRRVPDSVAAAMTQVLARIRDLPIEAERDATAIPLRRPRSPLPDWLLPRRVLGAFYVVRSLGSGGAASVFLARRLEERHAPKAEAFALKVPIYDPTTARALSEQQFMDLFRAEAGALLSLPVHPNLSRFVTFDLAARPKPILVMELIRGVSLDRAVRNRSLTFDRARNYLDGILQGLEAMHEVGVGHLDVKPSNVIVRATDGTPVLVDFGLSGRHLRPGCGTLEYTAPEVLGVVPDGHEPLPMDADVYAFGCTAFELLTGEVLLKAPNETALVALHLQHDGWPEGLAELAEHPEYTELARALAACLRRDPRDRPGTAVVREMLNAATAEVRDGPWPLFRRSTPDLTLG